MSDGDERPCASDFLPASIPRVLDDCPAEAILVREPLLNLSMSHNVDLRMTHSPLVHHLRGSESLAPVDYGDLTSESSQESSFLHRRVTPSHYNDLLVSEEGTVASRASRDTPALLCFLPFYTEPDGLRAGADDYRLGTILLALYPYAEGPIREVNSLDVLVLYLESEALSLLAHVNHHFGPADSRGVSRKVLDIRGQHQLPSGHIAGEHQRVQHSARSVQTSCVTSWT